MLIKADLRQIMTFVLLLIYTFFQIPKLDLTARSMLSKMTSNKLNCKL